MLCMIYIVYMHTKKESLYLGKIRGLKKKEVCSLKQFMKENVIYIYKLYTTNTS